VSYPKVKIAQTHFTPLSVRLDLLLSITIQEEFFLKQRRIWLYLLRLYRLIAQLFFVRKSLLLIQAQPIHLQISAYVWYYSTDGNRQICFLISFKDELDHDIFAKMTKKYLSIVISTSLSIFNYFRWGFSAFLDRMRSLFPNLGHLPFFSQRSPLSHVNIFRLYYIFVSKAQRSFRCFLSC
jgi:hypothetical protein